MSKFQIGIVGYGKNPHAACFLDHAKAVAAALRDLGHEVRYAEPGAEGRLILFGANNLFDPTEKLPPDTIIFNSEQLAAVADPTFFLQNYLQYRGMTVWDYSSANVQVLRRLGITRAVHCPVGYHPSMERIKPAEDEDIDVLFYGSVAGPRREILDAMDAAGVRVQRLYNVYDAERDAYIARSKVVLNLHFYPNGVFEIFRVSHLLANKKCVLTEAGGCDEELESLADLSCAYVAREHLVEIAQKLVGAHEARREIAELGYAEFKKIDLVECVRRALAESEV